MTSIINMTSNRMAEIAGTDLLAAVGAYAIIKKYHDQENIENLRMFFAEIQAPLEQEGADGYEYIDWVDAYLEATGAKK